MTKEPHATYLTPVPSPAGNAGDGAAGPLVGPSRLEQSARDWQEELFAMMSAGAEALNDWQEGLGISQSQYARVVKAHLPADDFRRSIGPSTRSRYRDPRHFWHASLAVAATMVHVAGHRWTDLARVMQRASDRSQALAQGIDEAEYEARLDVRAALIERMVDVAPQLTDQQLREHLVLMGIQARENGSLRVGDAETHGTPLDRAGPNFEARSAGRAARQELQDWADELRGRSRRDEQAP